MTEADWLAMWITKATSDFDNAKFLYDKRWPRPLELVCYLCQQAGEKALKAYLIFRDADEVPYTHDLKRLCGLCCEYDACFEDLTKDCALLTPYATDTRYPNLIEITEPETEAALCKAERILLTVTNLTAPQN